MLLSAFQFLAIMACTLFTGAALYVTLVEHPARMGCDTRTAATVWAPSYKRATPMQASLAVVGFIAAFGAWRSGGTLLWLIGALLIGSVVPFTLVVIKRVNDQLLAPGRDLASAQTRTLLVQWGKLHAVRTWLGLAASVIFVSLVT